MTPRPGSQPPRRRSASACAALVALALAMSACGGDGASAGAVDPRGHPDTPTSQPEPGSTVPPSPIGGAPAGEPPIPDPVPAAPVPAAPVPAAPVPTSPSPLPLLPTTTTTFLDRSVDPPTPVADPGGPPGRNSVIVVGDSVFMGTAREIPLAMSHWLVTYDATESRRLAQAVDLFVERRGEIGEAVVIGLGNNYIPGERGDYASQIDEVMSLLWFVPRVVWVTVAEVNTGRDQINASIRDAARRWPNMAVADWAPLVAADPSLSWDGIHLSPEGRRALARLVAEAVGPVDLR
jgi:hypothetical protein